MFSFDPYGDNTLNTLAATYACWECPEQEWCKNLPPEELIPPS